MALQRQIFKLKNQLLFIWIDAFPYRLGRQTSGKKSGMAKELVDYDFDCLLFCWSSAVCPFKIFLVLIVPPLWRDCYHYTSISGKLIEKSQTFQLAGSPEKSGLKKRGLPKPRHISIFHFFDQNSTVLLEQFSLLSSIATIWDRKRADRVPAGEVCFDE